MIKVSTACYEILQGGWSMTGTTEFLEQVIFELKFESWEGTTQVNEASLGVLTKGAMNEGLEEGGSVRDLENYN
jgi:hypothetical protein